MPTSEEIGFIDFFTVCWPAGVEVSGAFDFIILISITLSIKSGVSELPGVSLVLDMFMGL